MSDWTCWSCEKPINKGDEYIKDEDGRYCSDCYESYQVTSYFVGGEFVGTNDDGAVEIYDWLDLEGENK